MFPANRLLDERATDKGARANDAHGSNVEVFIRKEISMSKSRNSSTAVQKSNQAADALLKKLERIKLLSAEILGADDFDDLDRKLDGIVGNLNSIVGKQAEVASADDFDDLDRKFDGIVGRLNQIIDKQGEVAE